MVKQAQTLKLRRWSTRTRTHIALPLVIALLFSIAMAQSWNDNSSKYDATGQERRGVEYLAPAGALLSVLVRAQSMAVTGAAVNDDAILQAVDDVSAVDDRNGDALGVQQRWNDLEGKIKNIVTLHPTGEEAYVQYTDIVQLTNELISKIADVSNLITDPSLDSHYIMDIVVDEVPGILVYSGRAIDLGSLASLAEVSADEAEQVAIRISVARYQVSRDADDIATDLSKALDATDSTTLGPGITNEFDEFKDAVDSFVPAVNLLNTLDTMDSATLVSTGAEVRETAIALMDAAFDELDKLLENTENVQSVRRSQLLGLWILGLLLTGLLVWSLVVRARQEHREAVSGLSPSTGAEGGPGEGLLAAAGGGQGGARESEELVQVGRGIRARRRERANDAR